LLLLWLTRFAFAAYNAQMVDVDSFGELMWLAVNGLRFDITAVVYFNLLFIAMRILPFKFTTNRKYLSISSLIYYITNILLLVINLCDIPYFRFSGSRMRWNSLIEMASDSNILGIIASYFSGYWWAYLLVIMVAALLIYLYNRVTITPTRCTAWQRIAAFVLLGAVSFLGMRGRVGHGLPLAIADASWNIRTAPQINVVLNSPFCVIRSINKDNDLQRYNFFTDAQLAKMRNSVHTGNDQTYKQKNVFLIVLESGSQLWLDGLNIVKGDSPRGIMPFLDSIATQSLVCQHTIATGVRSIEGISAILGGFPTFDPYLYMLSPYNSDILDAPAALLAKDGYNTMFYYGCGRGSFNIDQMAHACGFEKTVDRDTYNNDSDFDGSWGIYDHAMIEYAIKDIAGYDSASPFFATWFSVTAHGPFNTPSDWQPDGYKYGTDRPEHGIEYTDRALRHLFTLAKREPWYNNTIFIITADHGNREQVNTKYDTPYIKNHVPFIVFTPDGSVQPEIITDRVMSQFDIPATLLSLLGYNKSYVSIGNDIRDNSVNHYGILLTNNQYAVIGTHYAIMLNAKTMAIDNVYDITTDQALTQPLTVYDNAEVKKMQNWAKSLLQDANNRIIDNKLSLSTCKKG
jgi:phosphoglycerol transferase MdoB-like AlkP superfamily enzyme